MHTMLEKRISVIFLVAFFFFQKLALAKPNFVIFLVDDLGIADLGCFGNDTIKTPNIDRLAAEGVRLGHDVTPDSICTPNRAAFLTGRYPIRSGLASDDGEVRVFIFTSASGGLPQNETTFAEVASTAGYKTGTMNTSSVTVIYSAIQHNQNACGYKIARNVVKRMGNNSTIAPFNFIMYAVSMFNLVKCNLTKLTTTSLAVKRSTSLAVKWSTSLAVKRPCGKA